MRTAKTPARARVQATRQLFWPTHFVVVALGVTGGKLDVITQRLPPWADLDKPACLDHLAGSQSRRRIH